MAKCSIDIAKKSPRRDQIVERLLDAVKDADAFRDLRVAARTERDIKQDLRRDIKDALREVFKQEHPEQKEETIKRKASDAFFWEGDIKVTINHTRFLGAQHRPDFKIVIDDLRIAVEIKLGQIGQEVREGIGQSLVYVASGDYDFAVFVFIDISADKKIRESLGEPKTQAFINTLWELFNVKFDVI